MWGRKAPIPIQCQWKLLEVIVVTIVMLNMSVATSLAAININVCNTTGCVIREF